MGENKINVDIKNGPKKSRDVKAMQDCKKMY